MYTYSVVIPHYNSPETLKRMLASIPEREDIQIIVVDDGSTNDAKERISELSHKNLFIEYLPENHGGGYARNAGFSKVEGKWFIGCDADDFFTDGAFDVLDKYKNEDLDCLYYCVIPREENTLQPMDRKKRCVKSTIHSDYSVRAFLDGEKNSLNLLKFRNDEPWNKMVSVQFLRDNNIHWENCRINIDVFWGLQIGLHSKKIKVIPNELYNFIFSTNSITRQKRSIEREFLFYLQVVKKNTIYKKLGLGLPFYRPEWLYIPFLLKKRGLRDTIAFYKYKWSHKKIVLQARQAYLTLLKESTNQSALVK